MNIHSSSNIYTLEPEVATIAKFDVIECFIYKLILR